MSAEVIDLALARANRAAKILGIAGISSGNGIAMQPTLAEPEKPANIGVAKPAFLFWTGASGVRYVHSVYNLFECPPVAAANYVLVKRHSDGHRTVISIGRAAHEIGTLNLADIRFRSAQLGANEVHVHLLAGCSSQSEHIEADLRGSLVVA